jgi:hypothetical protein
MFHDNAALPAGWHYKKAMAKDLPNLAIEIPIFNSI